jgi:hypothetical protein
MPDVQRLRSLADFTTDVEAFVDDVRNAPLSFTRQRLSKLADGLGVPMPIPGTPLAREVRLER